MASDDGNECWTWDKFKTVFPIRLSELCSWLLPIPLLQLTTNSSLCSVDVATKQLDFCTDLLLLVLDWKKGSEFWEERAWAEREVIRNKHSSKAKKDSCVRGREKFKGEGKETLSMKSRKMTGTKTRHEERELFKVMRPFHSVSIISNPHTVCQPSSPFIFSTFNVNL